MRYFFLSLMFCCGAFSAIGRTQSEVDSGKHTEPILITWQNTIPGNFSFTRKWDYPDGIARLPTGKPGCADGGFCDPRAQAMQGKGGYVPKDSLAVFYSLIDTTHRHYSIEGQAQCYEYAGTNYINSNRSLTGVITASTEQNTATHCSLELLFAGDSCLPEIYLNSIVGANQMHRYYANGGSIQIDSNAWEKDILKATFNFTFTNTDEPEKPIYWRGKIYTPIVDCEE